MSLGIKRFVFLVVSKSALIFKVCADFFSHFGVLTSCIESVAPGRLSLACIYEQGSSVVSMDVALAYAMYCLSAERQGRPAREEKKSQLEIC